MWTLLDASEIELSKDSLPRKFVAYKLDIELLRNKLKADSTAPSPIQEFPLPDSTFSNYRITEVQVMAPALAAKFPQIKTYEGVDITNPANKVRLDFNERNFHAYFTTLQSEFFIGPVDEHSKNRYLVYKKEDSPFSKMPFEERK